jgi:KaiC/GvpD/RAD55 family RecA-like ATPase
MPTRPPAPLLWWFLSRESEQGAFLVAGPQSSGKTTLVNQQLYNSLAQGHRMLYVAVDNPPQRVAAAFAESGWNLRPYIGKRLLAFVDCYTRQRGVAEALWEVGAYRTRPYYTASPTNLPELAEVLKRAQEEFPFNGVILDSLTRLVADDPLAAAERFLGDFAHRARVAGAGWVTVNTDATPLHTMHRLKTHFDTVVELKLLQTPQGRQHFLRAMTMDGSGNSTAWHPYRVTSHGIDFVPRSWARAPTMAARR